MAECLLLPSQESNLLPLRSAMQPLLRLFRRGQQTLDDMKATRLEGTLQVRCAGGVPLSRCYASWG